MIPLLNTSIHRIAAAAERHFDRMLDAWNGPDIECSNCRYWDRKTGMCEVGTYEDLDAEPVPTEASGCCDQHEFPDYDPWDDEDPLDDQL